MDALTFGFEYWVDRQERAQRLHFARVRQQLAAEGRQLDNRVCRYWLAGRCSAGANLCVFSHVYDPWRVPLCTFGASCPDAKACAFRHDLLPYERVPGAPRDAMRLAQSACPQ